MLKKSAFLIVCLYSLFCFFGCESGYKFSEFIEKITGSDSLTKRQQAFGAMQKCLAAYEAGYTVSERVLERIIAYNLCFDKKNDKLVRNVAHNITSALGDVHQELSVADVAKLTQERIDQTSEKMSRLAAHYNDLQNMFDYCRTKDFLNTAISPKIEAEKKSGSLLLHAVGDIFGENSGLEGNESSNTMTHRLFYLKNIKDILAKNQYIIDEAQANPCKDIKELPFRPIADTRPDFSQSILDIFIKKHENALKLSDLFAQFKIEELRKELKTQLSALSQGDSIFVAASWTKHAFLYQWFREENKDSYTFRIYNSGDGINAYHTQTIKGYEKHYLPFAEVTELSQEKLTSYTFLKALTEITIPETYHTKPEHFYEKVLYELGGKPSKNTYDTKDFKAAQQAGTCSYFSQPWMIEAVFDQMIKNGTIEQKEALFPARLEALFGLKTLSDYARHLRNTVKDPANVDESKLTLLDKSMVFYSGSLINAAASGAVSAGFFSVVADFEEPLKQEIQAVFARKAKPPAKESIDFSKIINKEVNHELNKHLADEGLIDSNSDNIISNLYILDPLSLDFSDLAKAINSINTSKNNLNAALKAKQYIQIIKFVQQLALKLSLDQGFLQKLTISAQAESLIHHLSEIQTIYVFSLIKAIAEYSRPEKTLTTTDLLTAIKLMSVADLLNSRYVLEEKRLPSLYQNSIGELLKKDIAIIEALHPSWQQELANLRAYYRGKSGESFFQFEERPTGFYRTKDNKDVSYRRIMYDPNTMIPEGEKHWSDGIAWNDVNWAIKWIKSQEGFSAWLSSQIATSNNNYNNEYIKPSYYIFEPSGWVDYHDNNKYDYYGFIMDKSDVPREYIDQIITRRQAVKLLGLNAYVNEKFNLPSVFFDLRQMSFEIDFLLTGRLDQVWAQGARFTNLNFNTTNEEFTYSELTKQYKDFEPNILREYLYLNDTTHRYEKVKRTNKNKERTFYKINTEFKGLSLLPTIFGQVIKYDNDLVYKDEKMRIHEGYYVSPYVHLQNGVLPFNKWAELSDRINDTIHDLMRIHTQKNNIVEKSYIIGDQTKFRSQYDPLKAQERRRLLPNSAILFRPQDEDIKFTTLERSRSLLTLTGMKKFQLVETLGLFSKHPELLFSEAYQRLFEKLMLEPRLLLDQLTISDEESAQFVKKLTDFCSEQYNKFKELDDIKNMAFILHMNQLFKLQVQYAIKNKEAGQFKVAVNLAKGFLKSPQLLLENAKRRDLSDAQKGLLYVTLADAFTYVDEFDRDDVAYMLIAIGHYKTFGIPDKQWENTYAQNQIKNLLYAKQSQIQQNLAHKNDQKYILNRVATRMRDDLDALKEEPEWQPINNIIGQGEKPVLYQATFAGTQFQIDVSSGFLYEDENINVRFPIPASTMERVFGTNLKLPKVVTRLSKAGAEKNAYKWTDQKTNTEIRIELDKNGNGRFQKEINGSWYQFVDDSQNHNELSPFLGNRGFKQGYDHWRQITVNAQGDRKVLIFDKTTKEQRYEAVFNNDELQSFSDITSGLNFAQLAEGHELIKLFSRLEDPQFIEVWKNIKNKIDKIVLPRLSLTFKPIDGTNQLDCGEALSKHRLADLQYTATIRGPQTYIVCEPRNGEGPRIALSALQPFVVPVEEFPSLSIKFNINRERDNGQDGSVRMVVYELPPLNETKDQELNSSIKATDNAAIYYLALRKWWTHDYHEARTLLLSGDAQIGPLSKSQGELPPIEWLSQGRIGIKTQDMDPRATAVRLLASSILLRQVLDYRLESYLFQISSLKSDASKIEKETIETRTPKLLDELINSYSSYLANLNFLGTEWLNFYDEWTLASFLAEKSRLPVIQNRLKVLRYLHPSRFEDETPVNSFQAQMGYKGGQGLMLAKAKSITEFKDLKTIVDEASKGAAPAAGASVLNAKNIFTPQNLGCLYDIAAGQPIDKDCAINLLKQIFSEKSIDFTALTDEQLRMEFSLLLRANSLYEISPKEGVPADAPDAEPPLKIARFLELVSQNKAQLPAWKAITQAFNDLTAISAEVKRLWDYINAQEDGPYKESLRLDHRRMGEEESNKENYIKNILAIINRANDPVTFAPNIKAQDEAIKDTLKKGDDKRVKSAENPFSQLLLSDPMIEPFLDEEKFNNLFLTHDLSDDKKKELKGTAESLKQALNRGKNRPDNIVRAIDNLTLKIERYTEKEIAESKTYDIQNQATIKPLIKEIKGKLKAAQRAKQQHELAALRLAGKQKAIEQAAYTRILRLAEADKNVDINDLIYLLLSKNLQGLQKATLEERDNKTLKEIAFNVIGYLLQSTYEQYLITCQQTLKDLQAAAMPEQQFSLTQKVADLLREKRHYNYKEHIEYLMFEHFLGLHVRANQVAALDKLEITDGQIKNPHALGQVLEMIMGFGKTSVLLPLISAMNTSGQWLNVIMLPEPLIASMSKELRRSMEKSFNRFVKVIDINRQTDLNENRLLDLYDTFVRARNEGITIVTTNSSMQSLFLSFTERLHRYAKDRNQVNGELVQLTKIFRFLREFGLLTIDEVDMALDVLKAHQFSIGERIPINETLTASAFAFYRMLAQDKRLSNLFTLPFLHNSYGAALSPEEYKKKKGDIVDIIVNNVNFFEGFSALNMLFRNLTEDNIKKDLLTKYWKDIDATKNRTDLFKLIDQEYINSQEANILKNMAAVLYDEINQVFLLTASKKLNVHYGKLPPPIKREGESETEFRRRIDTYKNSTFIAIPYHAGQPAINSRFATPLEVENYALQRAIEERQFELHVALEIDALKNQVTKVSSKKDIELINDRFNKLIHNVGGIPTKLNSIDNKHIRIIAEDLKKDDRLSAALDLIKFHTLPQLKTYETQLHTNAQIYQSLFRVVSGISGTLWSVNTFPEIFNQPEVSDTTEKTLLLLWREYQRRKENLDYKAVRSIGDLPDASDQENYLNVLIDQIYANGMWSYSYYKGSLLDQGGLFRGFSNHRIAAQIANKLTKRSAGVIYYDDSDQIAVYEKANGQSATLLTSNVAQNDRVAYWDKQHTTGSDLKLRPNMSARMTFDHHTFSRDLQQTSWRLRGLGQGQSIDEYLVLEQDLALIKQNMMEILGFTAEELNDFDLGELLLYVVVNEEMKLGDLIHRSLKHKLSNAITLEVLDDIFAANTSNQKAASIYKSFSHLFEKSLDQEPFTYLGMPSLEANKEQVIESDIDKIFGPSTKIALANVLSGNKVAVVQSRIQLIKTKVGPLLPTNLKMTEMEAGLEIEVEMEQELEQQQEVERQIEQYQPDRTYKEHPVLKWPRDNIFKEDYFTPIKLHERGPILNDKLKIKSVRPIFKMRKALANSAFGQYKKLSQIIDKNILGTLNFAPLHHKNIDTKEDRYEFSFFSLYQKDISNVLVILDTSENKPHNEADIKVVVLDNNDVADFDEFLRDDLRDKIADQDHILALYNIEQGIFRQGHSRIDEDLLKKNEEFIRLITQIKFLNGDLTYQEDQKRYLEQLISTKKDEIFKLFKRILNYKQDSSEQMRHSDIGYMFENSGVVMEEPLKPKGKPQVGH